MKKVILTLAIATFTLAAMAQSKDSVTTNFAHWVVESNVNTPKVNTVKFYDAAEKLIYEETVNARIDVRKKGTQKALNQLLNVLVNKNEYAANKTLLSVALNLRRN